MRVQDEGLKDFQRRTVDHVCRRILDEGACRFLVADEVGLGKTLIARGVVSRTVARLQEQNVKRVDVVYICSNQEIARQNLKRLKLPGHEEAALSSRLTLLPLHIKGLRENGVNFISFTPGTSFDQGSGGGWAQERALLLKLLTPVWGLPRHRGVFEFFRGGARLKTLKHELKCLPEADDGISLAFQSTMESSPLRGEVHDLIQAGRRRELKDNERRRQQEIIGELRRALAVCCVDELEPDLVIMDEFQRFAELLDGDTPAAELAKSLFAFKKDEKEYARVLLLSATPYRAYSRAGEDGEAHQAELQRLLTFLFDDAERAERVHSDFVTLRDGLLNPTPDEPALVEVRDRIGGELSQVMVRTERLASSATRNGMLEERDAPGLELTTTDVTQWRQLARLHRLLREQGFLASSAAVTEYWKSAPWLAQFMDGYQFKRALKLALECPVTERAPELTIALKAVRGQLDWRGFRAYGDLAPANARMRSLRADTVERTWDLLWMPPALPYHVAGAPYDRFDDAPVTKRLVFSSWDVVPRAIAGYLSYEAERLVHASDSEQVENTPSARRVRERRLLDFKLDRTDGETPRPASMATLAMLAPNLTLERLGDPLAAARELTVTGLPSMESVVDLVHRRIRERLADLPEDHARPAGDARWYWAAPLLLDQEDGHASSFWQNPDLAGQWATGPGPDSEIFAQHVKLAGSISADGIKLGPQPEDLADVLTDVALAGPAIVASRALRRVLPALSDEQILTAGAQLGWGLRSLFNSPEAIAILDTADLPYWRSTLRYAIKGNLQAVFDEWMHVVVDDVRGGRGADHEILEEVVNTMFQALSLSASRVEVDQMTAAANPPWRTHFAVRYGQAKVEAAEQSVHPQAVRRAFNSPMRPFVLASTSVGQEGLDFHTYCHAIVHWNLPSNPIDLEQREGRIHRYKGRAVRRNVAEAFAQEVLHGTSDDPWTAAFAAARAACAPEEDELSPYWLYPGRSVIERYVPALPLSKDAERYERLKREVALYRMVFGQPRQDDLIAYLRATIGDDRAERLAELIRIDLAPPATSKVAPMVSTGTSAG